MEIPEKVEQACQALMPHLGAIALSGLDPNQQIPIPIWMHRGCVPFISHDHFNRIYWPTLKPIVENIWARSTRRHHHILRERGVRSRPITDHDGQYGETVARDQELATHRVDISRPSSVYSVSLWYLPGAPCGYREDGENPSQSRCCNRGRTPQSPLSKRKGRRGQ